MARNPSNDAILGQLRAGVARFELVQPDHLLSVSSSHISSPTLLGDCTRGFFARIGAPMGGSQTATKKAEQFSVQRVTGDGRCLFRALNAIDLLRRKITATIKEVKGMAYNKGNSLSHREEKEDADDLRMAVKEVICGNENERHEYEGALISITVEESLNRYCQRIGRPDFWGGESELLVLSKLCKQPIVVYIPEHEHKGGGWGKGFIAIAEYGGEFGKASMRRKARKAVRLLYSGRNHYDLLV